MHEITEEKPFDARLGLTILAAGEHRLIEDLRIVKVEVFANDKLICTDAKSEPDYTDNHYIPCDLNSLSAGAHKIQAIVTDSDGSVGKSALIEVVIKK